MSEYGQFSKLPVYNKLRTFCLRMRDEIVVPMREDLRKVRDELSVEQERLAQQHEASRPAKSAPTAPVDGLVDGTQAGVPGNSTDGSDGAIQGDT